MGLLTDRRNSRYDNQSSCPWFDMWQRPCDVTVMKWMYCRYAVLMIYSVILMRWPLRLHMLYLFHTSEQHRVTYYRRHDCLSMCFCCLTTKESQSSTYCPFLRVIYRWLVNSLHKGRVMRKVFPCHDVTGRHTAHTIVSWPNPKQWQMVHTSDLMMIIDDIHVFSQSSQER